MWQAAEPRKRLVFVNYKNTPCKIKQADEQSFMLFSKSLLFIFLKKINTVVPLHVLIKQANLSTSLNVGGCKFFQVLQKRTVQPQ